MTYIVENNGVYGLTKGQFSATADRGSKSKRGVTNTDNAIDLVAIALQLGASFVARSFSGDKTQLVPLIEAAIEHQGAAFIDVISPCVAFNNHAGSTKSFDYVREHNEAVNRLDVITGREPITVDYAPGTVQVVEQHDGTRLALRKLDADYDVHDRLAAMAFLQKHAAKGQVVTGLLYVDPDAEDLHAHLNTVDAPLNALEREGSLPRHRRAGEDQRQRCGKSSGFQPFSVMAGHSRPKDGVASLAYVPAIHAFLLCQARRGCPAQGRARRTLTLRG